MLRARVAYTPHLGLYCIYYVVLRFEPRARGLGRCSATDSCLQPQVFPEHSDHIPFLGIFI